MRTPALRDFTFTSVTVGEDGRVIDRPSGTGRFYAEDLGSLDLDMVAIKGGTFLMGSPADEKGSPIHKATYNGRPDILKMLMEHPDIDLNVQGPINGYSPLHDALWHGYTECAQMLIFGGARLDTRGHDGKLPLDVAISVYGADDPLVALIRERMAASTP